MSNDLVRDIMNHLKYKALGVRQSLKGMASSAARTYLNSTFKNQYRRMLFLCGHMRSGSSLLVHILNTHPQIIGYGETHISYHDASDFGRVALDIYSSSSALPRGEKFVLDKILHPHHLNNTSLLERGKTIFLIRNPSEALTSIFGLQIPRTITPQKTFEYYVERMRWIRETAQALDTNSWTYTTYHELTHQSHKVFRRIEAFLDLEVNLTKEYQTVWATGKRGIGDASEEIHVGKIIQKEKEGVATEMEPYVEKAQIEFGKCLDTLLTKSE